MKKTRLREDLMKAAAFACGIINCTSHLGTDTNKTTIL